MKLVPHLTFAGNCNEAMEFYRDLFQGSLVVTRFGESPASDRVPKDWHDKIVHGTLTFGNWELAGADVPPEEHKKAEGFYLLVEPKDANESERLFSALAEGGEVLIPLQEMFWSVAYGSVVDRFGTPWEISCTEAPAQP